MIPKEEVPVIPAIIADKAAGNENDVSWIVHGFSIYFLKIFSKPPTPKGRSSQTAPGWFVEPRQTITVNPRLDCV